MNGDWTLEGHHAEMRQSYNRYVLANSRAGVIARTFGPALNAEAGRWQAFKEKCL